jgi:hypothetical protein
MTGYQSTPKDVGCRAGGRRCEPEPSRAGLGEHTGEEAAGQPPAPDDPAGEMRTVRARVRAGRYLPPCFVLDAVTGTAPAFMALPLTAHIGRELRCAKSDHGPIWGQYTPWDFLHS